MIEAQSGGTINIASNVTGTGSLVVDGGRLNVTGSVAGTQAITIDGAGVVRLAQIQSGDITFEGAGMLVLDDAPASGLTVHDFGLGDSIVLANLAYSAATTLSWNTSTNTLTVTSESGASESIHFAESHILSDFALTADPLGTGGIDIVYNNSLIDYASPHPGISPGLVGKTGSTPAGLSPGASATTAWPSS